MLKRLAHLIRYVLRLPHRAVRRKSYAGAMFDIEDSIQKRVETEMLRFRMGLPNTADKPTRYLKLVAYHYSSVDPEHEGCAAHGSDTVKSAAAGLERLIGFQQAIENNFSQIAYVREYHGDHYADIGHAERFIGAGVGFEEIQLRNLMYFAYLDTVEEATADLDVGIKIFTGLNVRHGLPAPVVVRFDYHGQVPGARERAVEHCRRVSEAIKSRYAVLFARGLLHVLQVVRDCNADASVEILECSVDAETKAWVH